ncbi:putative ribonuclease H-like domain-containing protein [Tanacetum coccineum]|uniref:Ribonuclease H-like domain-containing protein n=1 Tax=Tanacetum coccineum TaxID=301880 RepID=A0ABQ4WW80_9ASTR
MSLLNLECFKFKVDPDPGNLTSIDPEIRKNVSTTNVNVPLEDDQSSLFAYVVWIFLAFLTYLVVPPYLLSTRNEDTIFDPGISMYHSFMPDVSHRNGTFMKFNVYPNRLNGSPLDCPDCEDSRALSFVFHPQEFHILSFILGIQRGAIDKTLFIKKDRRDIMLVQVYVDDIIFGSTKSSMVKDFEDLMQKEFKMSSMGELTFFLGLQVKQSNGGIFLSQDKYVKDILNKFDFRTIKPASTPIEAHKSLGKDEEGEDVDVHLYRSMIGCLMYLTASRPDIMFAVCLCARFQVTPKVSHLHAVKRIFRYLKHQPKLGLWYPKDFPFHFAGDNHDRRSTSGGCQYLGRRLVSWQCKKQTIVAISSTEAEYVAAASCCAQVLWMQNQLLDYGFNFMNTEIHIDNESTICIVKNPVFHSKTKHIQIRHHFIRDCYEQRLINVVKVHTDDNVADLLTKGFDLARFNFLVVTIGMMNP